MNRTTKKCLIASLSTHGMLLLALLIGSAFVTPAPKIEAPTVELIDIPDFLINEDMAGGGGNPAPIPEPPRRDPPPRTPVEQPVVQPPPPRRAVVEPVATPRPVQQPEPNKPEPAPVIKPVVKPPPKPAIQIADTAVRRTVQTPATAAPASTPAPATARLDQVADRLARNIQSSVSSSTSVQIPGPGGASYASYASYLKKTYEDNWVLPAGATGRQPMVEVEIVVARDGRVVSAKILKKSGNVSLDNSVQTTLDRIRKLRPLPDGTTDPQRTFRINFNLSSKLSG